MPITEEQLKEWEEIEKKQKLGLLDPLEFQRMTALAYPLLIEKVKILTAFNRDCQQIMHLWRQWFDQCPFLPKKENVPTNADPLAVQLNVEEYVKEEREACAKIAESFGWLNKDGYFTIYEEGSRDAADEIAKLIRDRK